jgi:hypothetical protein
MSIVRCCCARLWLLPAAQPAAALRLHPAATSSDKGAADAAGAAPCLGPQALLGLHHMHSRKVLHRDVKTLNIFLDEQLGVKIGDLGVGGRRCPEGLA